MDWKLIVNFYSYVTVLVKFQLLPQDFFPEYFAVIFKPV